METITDINQNTNEEVSSYFEELYLYENNVEINEIISEKTLLKRKKNVTNILKRVFHINCIDKDKGIQKDIFREIYNKFVNKYGENSLQLHAIYKYSNIKVDFFTLKTFEESPLFFENFDKYFDYKMQDFESYELYSEDTEAFEHFYHKIHNPDVSEFYYSIKITTFQNEPK
jgi:hypothetical protein